MPNITGLGQAGTNPIDTTTSPTAPSGPQAPAQPLANPPSPSAAAAVTSPAFDNFIDPPGYVPPIETAESYTPALLRTYPESLVKTPNGGEFTSRLETETKWSVPLASLDGFHKKIEQLINDQSLRDSVLGPGWTLTAVKKYFRPDGSIEPMYDQYYDTKDFALAKAHAALRFRWLKGDPFCAVNMKPGPGVTDTVGVTTRIEYGLAVKPEVKNNPLLMERFFQSNEHLNSFRFLKQLVPGLKAHDVLRQALEIIDYRYKVTAQNTNGTEIEISLDNVYATLSEQKPASGSPLDVQTGQVLPPEVAKAAGPKGKTVHYGQLELEVNHKQLVASGGGHVATYTPTLQDLNNLENEYKKAGYPGIPNQPRIHIPRDMKHPAISQDPTYKTHQQFTLALEQYLYGMGNKAPLGQQKAAVAAGMFHAT